MQVLNTILHPLLNNTYVNQYSVCNKNSTAFSNLMAVGLFPKRLKDVFFSTQAKDKKRNIPEYLNPFDRVADHNELHVEPAV